jgi:hypothetical protein
MPAHDRNLKAHTHKFAIECLSSQALPRWLPWGIVTDSPESTYLHTHIYILISHNKNTVSKNETQPQVIPLPTIINLLQS